MGTLSGLLYQGLSPVFADVDAGTLNIDPASVRRRITGRTRAIVAVHHSGLSADMDELLSIVREAGIPSSRIARRRTLANIKAIWLGLCGRSPPFR
jgi:dTDP-4-amino-4,6-dideoxygalactose transaminase